MSVPETGIYRVVFEVVGQASLGLFTEYDPALSKGHRQTVPNSQIPDEHWHKVEGRPTSEPWQQYNQLRQWDKDDKEFVRNIRLEQMVSEPVWAEVKR